MKIHLDLLLINAFILTMDQSDRQIDGGYLGIRQGKILDVGVMREDLSEQYSPEEVIDCSGKIIVPGFISTHAHLFQSLLKGLGRDLPLLEWLNSSIIKALPYYDEEMLYMAAKAGICDNIHSGTTTIVDFQYCHVKNNLDFAVGAAFKDLGVRGVIASSRTNGEKLPSSSASKYIESEEQFFYSVEKLTAHFRNNPLINTAIAPCIIWDMSEDGFRNTRRMADALHIPVTMHVLETLDDDIFCQETYGTDTVSFLEKCGVLGPDFSAVHAVHLTDKSMQQLYEYGSSVSHCPASNMILGSGQARVPDMLEMGINVALACDGAASNDNQDMLETLKIASLLHKLESRNPSVMPAYESLKSATIRGARLIGQDDRIGSLEIGKEADFFIYNPKSDSGCMPLHDPVAALVYSAGKQGIESVFVHGNRVLSEGVIDKETSILESAQQQAGILIEKAGLGNFKKSWIQREE
ncbi:MAG: amidohydrolase [Spirochaetales bacterium]|nr:amidohydrolase [Spirochaetales bacterium]